MKKSGIPHTSREIIQKSSSIIGNRFLSSFLPTMNPIRYIPILIVSFCFTFSFPISAKTEYVFHNGQKTKDNQNKPSSSGERTEITSDNIVKTLLIVDNGDSTGPSMNSLPPTMKSTFPHHDAALNLHSFQPVRGFSLVSDDILSASGYRILICSSLDTGGGSWNCLEPEKGSSFIIEETRKALKDTRNKFTAYKPKQIAVNYGKSERVKTINFSVNLKPVEISTVECTLTTNSTDTSETGTATLSWISSDSQIPPGSISVPVIRGSTSLDQWIEFRVGDYIPFLFSGGTISEMKIEIPEWADIRNSSILMLSPALKDMVLIPGGEFITGDSGENESKFGFETKPRSRHVNTYWIDRYEYPGKRWAVPMVNVSWYEAASLCKKQGKRLCSEWEWEKACRGPDNLTYPYGNHYSRIPCFTDRKFDNYSPAPSGSFPGCVSPFGVYDMSGNVNEWTSSTLTFDEVKEMGGRASYGIYDYSADPADSKYPILRGGDWGEGLNDTRCSNRDHYHLPYSRLEDDGFRCCRDGTGTIDGEQ